MSILLRVHFHESTALKECEYIFKIREKYEHLMFYRGKILIANLFSQAWEAKNFQKSLISYERRKSKISNQIFINLFPKIKINDDFLIAGELLE